MRKGFIRKAKRHVVHSLHSAFGLTGAGRAYARLRDLSGAVILMYHSVAPRRLARWIDPRNRIAPGTFARQMRFLARCRNVISMSRLVAGIERGSAFPPGTVVITFDDGYRDTLRIAAPILRTYHLPAAVYIPTGCTQRREAQWVDRLYSMFSCSVPGLGRRRSLLTIGDRKYDLRDHRQRDEAYSHACRMLLPADVERREHLLIEIKSQLAPRYEPPRLAMTWQEVRDFSTGLPSAEIGVHTRDHVDCSSIAPDRVRDEIQGCAEDASQELRRPAEHFAFPYNRSSEHARAIVRETGLRSAVSNGSSPLIGPTSNPYHLARIAPPVSMAQFRYMTSGAYPHMSVALMGTS